MDSKYFMDLDLDLDLHFQINANPNPRIQVHAALMSGNIKISGVVVEDVVYEQGS